MAARRRAIEEIESRISTASQAILAGQAHISLNLGPLSSLPGRSVAETKRVDVLLRILDIIHQALIEDVVVTKRDIFYRDPELFGSQGVVDRVVDSLAKRFHVDRAALNVAATAKGVVIGDFTWLKETGQEVSGLNDPSGTLVTEVAERDTLHTGDVAWILVVEKDATFKSLVSARLHSSPNLSPGIIITVRGLTIQWEVSTDEEEQGKGYPDVATRMFLRRLSISHSRNLMPPQVFVLVDNDPDGLSILSTYKYGSLAFEHQSWTHQVPRMKWLGVRQHDISGRISDDSALAFPAEDQRRGLLQLTTRDRKKALSMLGSKPCAEDGPEPDWRREIQVMLVVNYKAEIQILEEQHGGTVAWLQDRLPVRPSKSAVGIASPQC